MSPMRFPRVAVVQNDVVIEYGYLNKQMPQSDGTYLYEIYGDSSARVYILQENDFLYVGDTDEPKWKG